MRLGLFEELERIRVMAGEELGDAFPGAGPPEEHRVVELDRDLSRLGNELLRLGHARAARCEVHRVKAQRVGDATTIAEPQRDEHRARLKCGAWQDVDHRQTERGAAHHVEAQLVDARAHVE